MSDQNHSDLEGSYVSRVLRSASKESNKQNVVLTKPTIEDKLLGGSETEKDLEHGSSLEQQITEKSHILTSTFQDVQQTSVQPKTIPGPSIALEQSNLENLELTKVKAHQIAAEIEVLKSDKSPIVSLPYSSRRDILLNELEVSLVELQETLSFVRSQNREIKEETAREEETNKQLTSVSEALQTQLQQLEEDKDDTSREKCKSDLQEKIDKAENYMKDCKKNLGSFVGKHFPLPSEKVFNDVKQKLRSADVKMTRNSTITLKKILEELISKCIEDPNDPYVIIDYRYWPPYVELLLRCQIVLRHPDDEQRIKLMPFHL